MSATKIQLTEDKYLFTFQDETQLWISREFIEKYPQLPFFDIIIHSEKYEDDSYYIDIHSSAMEKVIFFLMKENKDISSLNLRDSYDIYRTLYEYSVIIDKEIQSDLLFHVKELFLVYLREHGFNVYEYSGNDIELCIPMELFSSDSKRIYIKGLFTPQRKEELLYYSLLYKMMNITEVNIKYSYNSNIPLEYICPSCIQDMFPSIEYLKIAVITKYRKSDVLLNPNSDEYIMEYIHQFYRFDYEMTIPEEYDYYTESEMNEYNKISSFDVHNKYYSHKLIELYNQRKEKNQLPKLYKDIVIDAIDTDDYSYIEMNQETDDRIIEDTCMIVYDDNFVRYDAIIAIKALEEGIKELTDIIDNNLFNKIMATHVFPNVTELLYDEYIDEDSSAFLFPIELISIIDTIYINNIFSNKKKEIVERLQDIALNYSIHIYGIDAILNDFSNLKELLEKKLVSFNKLFKKKEKSGNSSNSNILNIKHAVEKLLNSNLLQNLEECEVSFKNDISMEELKWIASLFNDNTFIHINELKISLPYITDDIRSGRFVLYESNINAINQFIYNGYFHNTKKLNISIYDRVNDTFFELYNKDNFQNLIHIEFKIDGKKQLMSAIQHLFVLKKINTLPSSTIILLIDTDNYKNGFIYNHYNSIFRYKYDTNSFVDTIVITRGIYMLLTINYKYIGNVLCKNELKMLLDCIDNHQITNLKHLKLYIDDAELLVKIMNSIKTGKIPKLKECSFELSNDISEKINVLKKQLDESAFIQDNCVYYRLIKLGIFH
ncbi:hypothetical protein WA158_006848 [Blastocystis sp. Blastoise]